MWLPAGPARAESGVREPSGRGAKRRLDGSGSKSAAFPATLRTPVVRLTHKASVSAAVTSAMESMTCAFAASNRWRLPGLLASATHTVPTN